MLGVPIQVDVTSLYSVPKSILYAELSCRSIIYNTIRFYPMNKSLHSIEIFMHIFLPVQVEYQSLNI